MKPKYLCDDALKIIMKNIKLLRILK